MRRDLAIAYRIYPGISKVPPIFSDNKQKLAELCLASMHDALEGIKYRIFVILDNCPPEYEDLFLKYFSKDDLEFLYLEKTGNAGTFKVQTDILLKQDFSENIYYAEDDYFYLPGAFERMLDFLHSETEPDFISSYDHLDYYNHVLHDYKYISINNVGQNWRTVSSTCMTFMTKKKTLTKTKKMFYSYAKRNYDNSLWISLTKIRIFSPLYHFKLIKGYKDYCKFLVKLLLFGWSHLFFRKKYTLFTPKPSLSTHMDNLFMAPGIDWQKSFEEYKIK